MKREWIGIRWPVLMEKSPSNPRVLIRGRNNSFANCDQSTLLLAIHTFRFKSNRTCADTDKKRMAKVLKHSKKILMLAITQKFFFAFCLYQTKVLF